MTWLSDIDIVYANYTWRCKEAVREDVRLMARVIRELAKVVVHLEADEHDGTVYFSSDKVAEALWTLSPDAKEVIDELAK